jgi:hypothetical protein
MKPDDQKPKGSRVVQAPPPSGPMQPPIPNRPLSVVLQHNEDVEWIWTSLPNGQRYVSGYNIVKRS